MCRMHFAIAWIFGVHLLSFRFKAKATKKDRINKKTATRPKTFVSILDKRLGFARLAETNMRRSPCER